MAYTPGARGLHGGRVDLEEAALVDLDPGHVGADGLGDGAAPDRDQHLFDLDLVAALGCLERDHHTVLGAFEFADLASA